MIDWDDAELPIATQAELLGLNRSSLYYKPVEPSPEEVFIKHRIDEIYTKYPFFGSRRITAVLNENGLHINRKAVQRHMREMGIAGISPGPNLSKRNLEHRIYPYLLRISTSLTPTRYGGLISLTSGFNAVGCISSPLLTGIPVTSLVGSWIRRWKSILSLKPSNGRCRTLNLRL
ncbi:integrase catalytic subunit [Bacillus methanolicus PB1]|uniref:Integrase catalytic subunit n=1 Tax=Bacillus methanolicus PB1 TaxID=997296 RepID=I3DUX7_BACMT|nr:integrase catalytic subunit [Bacillus methanolicus PB1]